MKPFLVHDHAGAQAAFGFGPFVGGVKEAVEEILKGIDRGLRRDLRLAFALDHLRGGDVHDRGFIAFLTIAAKALDIETGLGIARSVAATGHGRMCRVHAAGDHRADQDADGQT